MNKNELIVWLKAEQKAWLELISEIPEDKLELPGVNGEWSIKDIIAHLTTYHIDHILCLKAGLKGEEPADPPWPMNLENLDAINDWIFQHNKDRDFSDVIEDNQRVFNDLLNVVQQFPDVITVQETGQYKVVVFGEQKYSVGYFFDHFHEDHEQDFLDWLKNQFKID